MSQSTVIAIDASSAWPSQRTRSRSTAWTSGTDAGDRLDLLDELGLDRVHQPPEHLRGRLLEDDEDDRGDEEPDERVRERVAGGDAERPSDDRERGQPVGPGVVPVGDERGRADRAADPDPVERDGLVADEADEPGGEDDRDVRHRLGVDEPADGLVGGEDRRRGDHQEDEQPGEVLGAAVAEGVAAGRGASADGEGDPERDRGEGIAEVVDRVGEQGDRARDEHDGELGDRGDPEDRGARSSGRGCRAVARQGVVDRVARIVAVADEHLDRTPQPAQGVAVRVVVAVLAVVVMVRPVGVIFLDTADIEEIRIAARWGVLDGVTTNPTLYAKVGGSYEDMLEEICGITPGPGQRRGRRRRRRGHARGGPRTSPSSRRTSWSRCP